MVIFHCYVSSPEGMWFGHPFRSDATGDRHQAAVDGPEAPEATL